MNPQVVWHHRYVRASIRIWLVSALLLVTLLSAVSAHMLHEGQGGHG